jgi:hypothetical protein
MKSEAAWKANGFDRDQALVGFRCIFWLMKAGLVWPAYISAFAIPRFGIGQA